MGWWRAGKYPKEIALNTETNSSSKDSSLESEAIVVSRQKQLLTSSHTCLQISYLSLKDGR